MSDMHTTASPGKTGKAGRSEAVRTGTKQIKQTDDGTTGRVPLKRQPQVPLHVRVQSKSQPEMPRPQETAPLIRRSRSGPPPSSVPTRAPLPSSPSPNLVHRSTQLPTQVKRAPSVPVPSSSASQQQLDPAKQKLVERAIKARLYLLYKSGPNRFLVGGDVPDSRFYVTIGPQQCTCNKTPCIHLLFVMVRVLKVSQNDPKLWQKQLRNYEAESLLQEFQARVSLRSTPKKIKRRSFDFSSRRSPEGETKSSHVPTKSSSDDREQLKPKTDEGAGRMGQTPPPDTVNQERTDTHRSDGDGEEEDVCPICLNELDEGEDLIVCEGCHNQLHQHCMDIWAGEQLRKNEPVHCPVCWTLWPHATPTISPSSGGLSMMPVSVPVGAEGGGSLGGLRLKSIASAPVPMSSEKVELRERLTPLFSPGVVDGLFSPDWKIREGSLTLLTRETITHFIPQLTAKMQPVTPGNMRETQEVCMQVVAHACGDSVLKVFLAALELMRAVLGYSTCHSREDADFLQSTLRPVLPVLLKRCADAQQRVKECSIDTVCNLCLEQNGPLSVGSASGSRSQFGVSDLRFVLSCVLSGEEEEERGHSWHWWLGRVNFLDRLISRFTLEFLLTNCVVETQCHTGGEPDSESTSTLDSLASNASTVVGSQTGTGMEPGHEMRPGSECPGMEPRPSTNSDSMSSYTKLTAENNLLVRAWYFAARATHVPHNKLGKVGRRVIIRIAKVLRDHPSSLEIVHDVVSKCHRTHAEGLLDRVLKVREKPREAGDRGSKTLKEGRFREEVEHRPARRTLLPASPEPLLPPLAGAAASDQSPAPARSDKVQRMERIGEESELVASDDSFRSAVSDLDGDAGRQGVGEASSSTSNSNDSKSGRERGEKGAAEGGVASGGIDLPSHVAFKRQSTVDSVFSTDMESSIDSGYVSVAPGQQCKKNIEEEEAEAEARVRSMLPQDMPHPSLSGVPLPSVEILIHVQPSGDRRSSDESTDGSFVPYLEGVHWVKGRLIGTGAFCSCYLARDVENGTMFAVKQVSYVRNTKAQEEEELKRLKGEVAMLSRINHPNLVRCLGATQHDGHINIFIEWMAGGCLDQILHDFGRPFVENVICNYTRQIIRGIVYLHEHGIIHRDLKGGNVLVDSTGQRIRIADFGAAARLASVRTGPGEFLDMEGTVAFMAPEVVRGGNIDDTGSNLGYGRKCDVWSIGCIIIQMATAKPPWVGTYDPHNKYQLIFKIGQTSTPPPLPAFSNPSLRDLTIRCLEVRPEDRPTSSELLKHSLFTESEN